MDGNVRVGLNIPDQLDAEVNILRVDLQYALLY